LWAAFSFQIILRLDTLLKSCILCLLMLIFILEINVKVKFPVHPMKS